jgi:hypothetical protein
LEKLRGLPPPTDYQVKDGNNPGIPMLVLTPQGAIINGAKPIQFEHVIDALADLPRSVWTQGRLIYYFEGSPGQTQGPPPREICLRVEQQLDEARIKLIWGLSL